jgi:hypothetical protein
VSRRAITDTSLFIAGETGRPLNPFEHEHHEIAVSIVTVALPSQSRSRDHQDARQPRRA